MSPSTPARRAVRLPDGRLLAVPPLHPRLPRWARQAIYAAVLRRCPFEALDLARELGAELDHRPAPGPGIVTLPELLARLPDDEDATARPGARKPMPMPAQLPEEARSA